MEEGVHVVPVTAAGRRIFDDPSLIPLSIDVCRAMTTSRCVKLAGRRRPALIESRPTDRRRQDVGGPTPFVFNNSERHRSTNTARTHGI